MGSDGAQGMQKLKQAGATTLAQDEETCVVYGMPRAAVELGAVDQVLPLERIPLALVRAAQARTSAARPSSAETPTESRPKTSLSPQLKHA
jgi:two-component system chemotaxis response regulator CheB